MKKGKTHVSYMHAFATIYLVINREQLWVKCKRLSLMLKVVSRLVVLIASLKPFKYL